MYDVVFRPAALRQLEDLPRAAQRRILARIESLGGSPRPRGCVKLRGSENTYRIRVGVYRVVYDVEDERLVVLIIRVRHRRDAYRR